MIDGGLKIDSKITANYPKAMVNFTAQKHESPPGAAIFILNAPCRHLDGQIITLTCGQLPAYLSPFPS